MIRNLLSKYSFYSFMFLQFVGRYEHNRITLKGYGFSVYYYSYMETSLSKPVVCMSVLKIIQGCAVRFVV